MKAFFLLLLLLGSFTMPILMPDGTTQVVTSDDEIQAIELTPTYVPWSPIPTPTRTWE